MPRKPYRTKIEPKRVEPGSEPPTELDGDAEDLTVPGALAAADLNVDGLVIPGVGNKVTAAAGWLSPRSLLVPVVARYHPALGR